MEAVGLAERVKTLEEKIETILSLIEMYEPPFKKEVIERIKEISKRSKEKLKAGKMKSYAVDEIDELFEEL